jgi:hypothetical protein
MANTFAPNGFAQFQGTGSLPTYEQVALVISSSNTTPIFFNDPVIQATNTTGVGTGYITQASAPAALAITNVVVTAGVATITFTATTAPAVGSVVVISGLATTNSPLNGSWTVATASTTTVTFNVPFQTIATNAVTVSGAVYIPIAGVFTGCKYLSTSQKRTVWGNYWPGSDANGDVTAYCITDPNAQFVVQTGNSNTTATAVGIAAVGQNIGFNYNDYTNTGEANGNTANGLSTYFADQYTQGSSAYLPFRVVGILGFSAGQTTSPLASFNNGSDYASAYNKIVVGFNNAMPNRPGAGI